MYWKSGSVSVKTPFEARPWFMQIPLNAVKETMIIPRRDRSKSHHIAKDSAMTAILSCRPSTNEILTDACVIPTETARCRRIAPVSVISHLINVDFY